MSAVLLPWAYWGKEVAPDGWPYAPTRWSSSKSARRLFFKADYKRKDSRKKQVHYYWYEGGGIVSFRLIVHLGQVHSVFTLEASEGRGQSNRKTLYAKASFRRKGKRKADIVQKAMLWAEDQPGVLPDLMRLAKEGM